MKKILFATTALVATASVAAADVTFSGYGRFGVQYTGSTDAIAGRALTTAEADAVAAALTALDADLSTETLEAALEAVDEAADIVAGTPAAASSTDVTSRLRIVIDANAESDAGVTFGAMVRIQQGEGEQGSTNGARFYAKSGGLEVGVGNIWGALESMPGQYPVDMGLTGLGYDYTSYSGDGYSSGGTGASGSNGIELMYSAGDFSAHISASDTSDRVAAFGAYTMSGWTVALAAQDSDAATDTEFAASVGGTIGAVGVGLSYTDNGTNGARTVLSGSMDVGTATNVEVYYASDDNDAAALVEDDSFGIDFNHSLGGGTSLRGGVVKRFAGNTQADFGVRFNF